MRRTTVPALLFSAFAIAAAGCGSASPTGTKASAAGPTTGATRTTSTTAAAGSSGAGIRSGSSFCGASRQLKAQEKKEIQAITSSSVTPAALEKSVNQAEAELPAFVALAPAAIRSDVQTSFAAEQTYFNKLKADGYDITKVIADPSVSAALSAPAFVQASNAIAKYESSVCGLSTTAATPTT